MGYTSTCRPHSWVRATSSPVSLRMTAAPTPTPDSLHCLWLALRKVKSTRLAIPDPEAPNPPADSLSSTGAPRACASRIPPELRERRGPFHPSRVPAPGCFRPPPPAHPPNHPPPTLPLSALFTP